MIELLIIRAIGKVMRLLSKTDRWIIVFRFINLYFFSNTFIAGMINSGRSKVRYMGSNATLFEDL